MDYMNLDTRVCMRCLRVEVVWRYSLRAWHFANVRNDLSASFIRLSICKMLIPRALFFLTVHRTLRWRRKPSCGRTARIHFSLENRGSETINH